MSSSCLKQIMPSIKPVVTGFSRFCYSRNKEEILEYLKTYDTLKKEMTFIDREKFKWINEAIQENDGAVTQRVDELEAEFLAFKRSNPAEVDNMYTQLKLYRRGACCVCPSWLRKKDQATLDHYFQLLSMNENDGISRACTDQPKFKHCNNVLPIRTPIFEVSIGCYKN